MRLPFLTCLIVVGCLLLESEARGGVHHHNKGEKHGHNDNHSLHHVRRGQTTRTGDTHQQVHMKKISWLNVPEVSGCKCRHTGEICILGPDKKPTCVQEHHLRESARLFKHYHEQKEKAEEALNEVDPPPHSFLRDTPQVISSKVRGTPPEAPHDVHINIISQHSDGHQGQGHQQQHFMGFEPKPGKHHAAVSHYPVRPETAQSVGTETAPTTCDNAALDEMRRRLTGWFHLLHGKDHQHHHGSGHHHRSHRHMSVKKELRESDAGSKQCDCLRSVMWEFRQLDTDFSHTLSKDEVKVIDNNDMEPCLHPYLLTCDSNKDGTLSRKEWCCCFPQKESESPCYAKLHEIEKTKTTEKYIPNCDHEGFYHKEQCMGGVGSSQTCWCVTPNGSEIPGSRITGRAHCGKLDNMGYPKSMS